jgi:2-keto-4-pentenoate hydratase/2-oxohepta-3-ene-1,7-dioic acid hydratase in catechol pathway
VIRIFVLDGDAKSLFDISNGMSLTYRIYSRPNLFASTTLRAVQWHNKDSSPQTPLPPKYLLTQQALDIEVMTFQLANYLVPGKNEIHAGLVYDGHIVDTLEALQGKPISLQDVYRNWASIEPQLKTLVVAKSDGIPTAQITLLPPSLEASSVYFAGFNYRDHVANMAKVINLPEDPDPKAVGLAPWHNLKPRNTLCGSGHTVELPSSMVDWEVELAVVIGRNARRVEVDKALDYVAGYTIAVDLSARDRAFRPHTPIDSVARMDWIAQKGFEGACPIGPWLTPASQIPDPQNLGMKLLVNDEVMQDSNTSNMIFSVAESVAHLSSMITLSPGDIILTGTPAGTGVESGRFLKRGDVIKATIDGLGELVVHTS